MSDTPVTDVLLGTLARNIFLAGAKAVAPLITDEAAERLWDAYEPSEADKAEVHALDARVAFMPDITEAMGDRFNRDTAALLDIAVAATIDQLVGHGTVTLRPARAEELVSRIAPRTLDPDGGWVLTLLPAFDGLAGDDRPVYAREVLDYVREGLKDAPIDNIDADREMASFVQAASKPGVTIREIAMAGFPMFSEWLGERPGANRRLDEPVVGVDNRTD